MNVEQKRIVELMSDNRERTQDDMVTALRMDQTVAKKALGKLNVAGVLTKDRFRGYTIWRIAQ